MLNISKFQQLALGSMAIVSALVVGSMPTMAETNTNSSNNGGTNVSNVTGTNVSNTTGTNASNASGAAREYKTRFRNNDRNNKPNEDNKTNNSNASGADREYKAKFRAEFRSKAVW